MPGFDWFLLGEYNSDMRITKCDICKKQIKRGDAQVDVVVQENRYHSFELCLECGKSIIKILKDKKLLENKKDGK